MPRTALRFLPILVLTLATGASCSGSNRAAVVTLITHSSPGGGSDVFLRTMAPHLSRMRPIVVGPDAPSAAIAKAIAIR